MKKTIVFGITALMLISLIYGAYITQQQLDNIDADTYNIPFTWLKENGKLVRTYDKEEKTVTFYLTSKNIKKYNSTHYRVYDEIYYPKVDVDYYLRVLNNTNKSNAVKELKKDLLLRLNDINQTTRDKIRDFQTKEEANINDIIDDVDI